MKYKTVEETITTKRARKMTGVWQKYVILHSIWYREKIQNPWQVVDAFLDASSTEDFIDDMYGILQSCSLESVHSQCSPADVLYFFERLESIINAAFLLWRTEICSNNNPSRNEITGKHACYAKTLSAFFSYRTFSDWKGELNDICRFALSRHTAEESGVSLDVLGVYRWSSELVSSLEQATVHYGASSSPTYASISIKAGQIPC